MYRPIISISLVAAVTLVSGCNKSETAFAASTPADSVWADSIARARQDSINRTLPGYVIDSILPVTEELRRFRAALPGDSATTFTGGSSSREALVRRFVNALVATDTNDLRAMAVHGREFADLYYPESPYSHAPYRQSPALAWSLIQNPSSSGLTKVIRRLGGQPMTYVSHKCDPTVLHEGHNTRYAGCLITIVDASGATITKRYFGSIVERDGKYKFMSYTNQF
ncbi:MAG: hypothetical protein ABIT20_20175 [Gemmatimonadaceae bacterium]